MKSKLAVVCLAGLWALSAGAQSHKEDISHAKDKDAPVKEMHHIRQINPPGTIYAGLEEVANKRAFSTETWGLKKLHRKIDVKDLDKGIAGEAQIRGLTLEHLRAEERKFDQATITRFREILDMDVKDMKFWQILSPTCPADRKVPAPKECTDSIRKVISKLTQKLGAVSKASAEGVLACMSDENSGRLLECLQSRREAVAAGADGEVQAIRQSASGAATTTSE